MSTDVSRVYQFLANYKGWEEEAAKIIKDDGIIMKSEFRTFMEEKFEWNGESTSVKNDLINSFWKEVDTVVSGNVKGSKLKNKNALDSNEIDKMNNKIEIYETLNEYLEKIIAPTEVNNKTQWKKSVSDSLRNYTETFIQNGGKAEDLAAYLDAFKTQVENKTTADLCAQEYIADVMGDIIKEYGYKYADDDTLKEIINAYVVNLTEGETPSSIRLTIQNVVDAYMATAGFGDDDTSVLKDYGYDTSSNPPLNGLQKAIVEKNIKTALKVLEQEEDYEANKDLYDKAITDFITKTCENAKYNDFGTISQYGVDDFKNDDIGRNLAKTIQVKGLFSSDELCSLITSKLGESLAELIKYDGKFLPIMQTIEASTMEKVQQGEFDSTDGTLDTQKVLDYIVKQIQANIAEFYPNGLNDMSIEELNNVYDNLVKSANNETDPEKSLQMHKDAAIKYCDALVKKSTALKEAVEDIFGSDYTNTINNMYRPSEITSKMVELKAKAIAIGDPKNFTIEGWGDLADEVSLAPGADRNYKLTSVIKNGENEISPDRISYSASVKSGDCSATITGTDSLKITAGSKQGYATIEVYAMVDGVKIGKPHTMRIKIEVNTKCDFNEINTKYNGYISYGNDKDTRYTPLRQTSFTDLYNNNGVINLLGVEQLTSAYAKGDMSEVASIAIKSLTSFVSTLASSCEATGSYDKNALEVAKNKVIEMYSGIINYHGDSSNWDYKPYEYNGEFYEYGLANKKSWAGAMNGSTDYVRGCSADNNQLGINFTRNKNDAGYQCRIVLNARCLMDFFNKFYEAALTK